jgi:hypothetical protein
VRGPAILTIISESQGTSDAVDRTMGSLRASIRLTEYGIIMVEPTFAALFPDMDLPGWRGGTVKPELFLGMTAALGQRRRQLQRFLAQGGVLCAFVGPPSELNSTLQYRRVELSPYALLTESDEALANMGLAGGRGTSSTVLFPEDPMAAYLETAPEWNGTLQHGSFPDANDRFPLAVNNQEEPIAYAEYVGRGVVYYLPKPNESGEWTALMDAARAAWETREDLLEEFGLDEEMELQERLRVAREDFMTVRDKVSNEVRALREERRTLVDRDEVLGRALRYYRAGIRLPQAKALASFYNMWEVVRSELGGPDQAMKTLGLTKKNVDRITDPANRPKLAARHANKEQPVPIDEKEMKDATDSASEIMRRYLKYKLEEWRATPPS